MPAHVQSIYFLLKDLSTILQYRLCPASSPLTEECFAKTVVPFTGIKRLSFDNGTQIPIKNASRFLVSEGTNPPGSTWSMVPLPPRWLGDGGNKTCCDPKHNCNPMKPGEEGTPCGDGPDANFPPPCNEGPAVHPETGGGRYPGKWFNVSGECSGCQPAGGRGKLPWKVTTVAAVTDTLVVPAHIAPGKWVLGWRWDSEATAQVRVPGGWCTHDQLLSFGGLHMPADHRASSVQVWQNCADIAVE